MHLDAAAIAALLSERGAMEALRRVLASGFRPSLDPARWLVPLEAGELFLMPSHVPGWAGVKVLGRAPTASDLGLPLFSGQYLLFDGQTLQLRATLDAPALTLLRTPAVSALAVDALAVAEAEHLLVIGTGAQARRHVAAVAAVRPLRRVTMMGRDPRRLEAALEVARLAVGPGVAVRAGTAGDAAGADVVVCATTSPTPVLDGASVPDHCCVVAVGSHEPGRRELDGHLMGRALVVVEDRATARREAGDVAMAIAAGELDPGSLVDLAEVVTGSGAVSGGVEVRADGTGQGVDGGVHKGVDTGFDTGFDTDRRQRPVVFKSVGMSWEDLAIAAEVVRRRSLFGS